MKKIVVLMLLTVFVSMCLIACTAPATETSAAAGTATAESSEASATAASDSSAEDKPLKVAGVVYQEDQFMKMVSKGYQDAAKDLGVEVLLANTNNDQSKEVEFVNTYVAQGLDGIAIMPLDPTNSVETLKKAAEAGVAIATTGMELNDQSFIVKTYKTDFYEQCVSTGKQAREFILNELGGKAKVGIIEGVSLVPEASKERTDGFEDQIKDLPGVEIVARQDAWLQDTGIQKAGDMLTANPDMNVIFAFNEGSTIGATMAVKNANKAGEVYVFGTDGGEQIISMLKDEDNILQCTGAQDPYTQGYKTMEALIKSIRGEEYDAEPNVEIVPALFLTRYDVPALDAYLKDFLETAAQS